MPYKPAHSRAAFYLLFTASGFAGLIYESIWTHYLKLFLGHAAYAQSLVLVVFMGGLAAGSALMGRWSTRIANPLLCYAFVEGVVGLLALAFHEVFVASTGFAYASVLPGLDSDALALAAKLALSALLILPQSVLLGMTFPLMSGGLVRAHPAAAGESVAMLYFTNSLGAAAGVLVSGFLLIEWAGLPGTLRFAGAINLVLAACVWLIARPMRAAPVEPGHQDDPDAARILLAVAFFTGLASFVYEISWIRMLALVLGASTHSFELMLSTFILGLALGGLAVRRLVDRAGNVERLLGWVQVAMGLFALSTLLVYDRCFDLMAFLMKGLARTDTGYFFFNLSGQAIAAIVMLPATFCAGMTLPLITGALLRRGAGEAAIGKAYAANTLGAIAGVLLAVHVGLPALGLKGAMVAGSAVDAALGLALLWRFVPERRQLAGAAIACVLLFLPVTLAYRLDANKMTSSVFRYGELDSSSTAKILFQKDGKTATVHLVDYSGTYSIRTNGKSDGSIVMQEGPEGRRPGSDEITMVLTGAIPLALKPHAKSAAVIGIGTGLTMHTLLQSLEVEKVETVEIEAAMAEASRGFSPRNGAAFADPRGSIVIDDAKSFFSTHNRRYDIIVSEPSNPWVSGVSGLFTTEFYRRIRTHLNPGGLLVQWLQLYETDTSLAASVLAALGGTFPHYSIYAPSDHDLLIVASEAPIPPPQGAQAFAHPGLTRELFSVHVLTQGDFSARYLGDRATLEPLFLSYGMPPNSDYAPVLDLNAARARFTERSAVEVVALGNLPVPVLEMLDPGRGSPQPDPLFAGAADFERIDTARLAAYVRDYLLSGKPPIPQGTSLQLQKDLELVKVRLLECNAPREQDVWLHSVWRIAEIVNPGLPPAQAGLVWSRISAAPCYAGLAPYQQQWIELFRAVGARDARRMAELAAEVLASPSEINAESREYLWMAGLTGYLAAGDKSGARRLWELHAQRLAKSAPKAVFRLLRCHAQDGEPDVRAPACAAEFRQYARR
ncbi:MAG: spermidine synthase [Proteobacteria bacterium]|nr:spermidine synthase [Pseudomonadota bacterium]